jgi:hypothetical protein
MAHNKINKVYRMKMRVRENDRPDAYEMVDVIASNAWDAEAYAEARVKRSYPNAYAIYAVSKRRVKA